MSKCTCGRGDPCGRCSMYLRRNGKPRPPVTDRLPRSDKGKPRPHTRGPKKNPGQ